MTDATTPKHPDPATDEVCIAELGAIVTGPYPTPAELLADRYGPAARPATDRAHAIAAIHALADFYTAHPDVPRPWLVRAHSNAADTAELQRIADEHRATMYGRGPQIDISVVRGRGGADPADGPTWVEVIVSVPAEGDQPL